MESRSDSTAPADVMEELGVVDLSAFLNDPDSCAQQCLQVKQCLYRFGVVVLRDPRVPNEENETFVDMMERYFEQPTEHKNEDVRERFSFQVGATPNHTEQARNHCSTIEGFSPSERPRTLCPPEADPKWRFFWRIGQRPEKTQFPSLNAEDVVPARFPEWPTLMNRWGSLLLDSCKTIAEMAARGFKLDADEFSKRMRLGPHLLAPTGSDLGRHGQEGTVFANFHYDLNFLTIHGRSRFPGLYIWLRDGRKVLVRIPPGCLLVQAGKQFEWLTGGQVLSGFHEVVVCPETCTAIEKARQEGRSLWRVSSTLFCHIASDSLLEPIGRFASDDSRAKYPPMLAGDQVMQELNKINLSRQ